MILQGLGPRQIARLLRAEREREPVSDWLLFGRETDGLPPELLAAADARLTIPMAGSLSRGGGVRSLNLSVAVGVVLYEALRQLEATAGQGF